jgi:hypothetical protein
VHVDHNGETDAVTHPDLVRRDEHRDSAIRIVGIRIIPTRCELGSMASSTSTCSSHDVTEFSTLTRGTVLGAHRIFEPCPAGA